MVSNHVLLAIVSSRYTTLLSLKRQRLLVRLFYQQLLAVRLLYQQPYGKKLTSPGEGPGPAGERVGIYVGDKAGARWPP